MNKVRIRLLCILLVSIMLLIMMPVTAMAGETSDVSGNSESVIDLQTFVNRVAEAQYQYDGNGITVEIMPESGCRQNHADHPEVTEGTPDRIQFYSGIAYVQYQRFSGVQDVSVSNVKFKMVAPKEDIVFCGAWNTSQTTAEHDKMDVELQFMNTGNVSFTDCQFENVAVSPISAETEVSFRKCSFSGLAQYAAKDVKASAVSVSETEFTDCSGGVYMNGGGTDKTIYQDNSFNNIGERGAIQFAASGNYTGAGILIEGNSFSGGENSGFLRQLNQTINGEAMAEIIAEKNSVSENDLFTPDSKAPYVQLPAGCEFEDENTVFDGEHYYKTLVEALTAIHKQPDGDGHILWCKEGADLGSMTHGHVCDDLTIYGNGAYISGGERDLELDTYNSSHSDGSYLTEDIDLNVYNLNGIAVWGQRNSGYTLNIYLEGCQNMNRVYISGTTGINNITLKNCTYNGQTEQLYEQAGQTAVYSNASGNITVENCTFNSVKEGINLNHEASKDGVQNISVKNCEFIDCSTTDICTDDAVYAAPVRIVAKYHADSHLSVENCTFTYTEGKETCNGDILLGEGRAGDKWDKVSTPVTAEISGTAAEVQIQNPGDRTEYKNFGKTIDIPQSDSPVVIDTAAVQIGDVQYANLRSALDDVKEMSGDVTITLLNDIDIRGLLQPNQTMYPLGEFDLSDSELTGLTIRGIEKDVQIISGSDGNDIDGSSYCPVLRIALPIEASLTVENLTFPNDLLFDTSENGTLVVQNCTFHGAQSGYPQAGKISYLNNLFEFKGKPDNFYTHNAYPVWYKSDGNLEFVFNGNTVKGYRGVHIETRSEDVEGNEVNIEVNNNHFELNDKDYENKEIALQLVSCINGDISFCNNSVNGYMGVCFFKDIKYAAGTVTVQNNYLEKDCKLYGSSEWNAQGSTAEEMESAADSFAGEFVKQMGENLLLSEGHTHHYVDGVCTICGSVKPSSGGSSSSGNKTETVTNPDGSTTTTVTKPDGSTTETTKNPDGSQEVVETSKDGTVTTTTTDKEGNKTEVVENTDGSSSTAIDNKDGSSSVTTTADGKTESKVEIPQSVIDTATEDKTAVALPMPEVSASKDKEAAAEVTVNLPEGTSAKVEVPVKDVTSGTVAVLVKEDGTEEVIKTSLTTENGVAVTVSDGDTIKIVDNSKEFSDVDSEYWGADTIDFATSRELFNGTSETTFSPENDMTRAMIVTVLARYEGVDTSAGDNWYEAGAQWAVENGVSDGTNLDNSVTREQLAAMLYRYAGEPEVTGDLGDFTDKDSVSDWASSAMIWAVDQGLIDGMGDGSLNPQGNATRAQVAAILTRFVKATN